jgi:Fe-S cluster biogenesis protein NfuA
MTDLAKQVSEAIAEMRPYLERSGAAVQLLGLEDGVAHVVAWSSARGHLVSNLTFVAGVERALMDKVPGLRGVAAVNLPPYTVLGWDKPGFLRKSIDLEQEKVLD